jgi:hypothetical protein
VALAVAHQEDEDNRLYRLFLHHQGLELRSVLKQRQKQSKPRKKDNMLLLAQRKAQARLAGGHQIELAMLLMC